MNPKFSKQKKEISCFFDSIQSSIIVLLCVEWISYFIEVWTWFLKINELDAFQQNKISQKTKCHVSYWCCKYWIAERWLCNKQPMWTSLLWTLPMQDLRNGTLEVDFQFYLIFIFYFKFQFQFKISVSNIFSRSW